MKQKSLAKNAIWNFLYSGVNMLFPLITAPYVSRILGASNLGEVDFSKSVVQWFVTFAAFGTTTYGVREIARVRENKEKMSKIFSELVTINFIVSILSTLAYFTFIFNNNQIAEELPLFIVMSLSIILNVFNIDWFYQGIEEYSYITIRNAIVKLLSLVAIFLFVQSQGDYIIYGLISVLGTSLSGILNLYNSRKFVDFSLKSLKLLSHFRSLLTFYSITFVINLYTNLDKTLLGFFDTSESVAYMTRSKTTTTVAISFSSSIAAVAMPRASYYLKNDRSKFNVILKEIPKFMMLLTIPITVGTILLAPEIMYILGGEEFLPASNLLRIVSLITIFSSLSTFLQSQVLVPSGNERLGLSASIVSSVVSLVANFTLIPSFSYMGAGIAVVLAEFTAVFTRYLFAKRAGFDSISFVNSSTIKFLAASISMSVPVLLIKQFVDSLFLSFVLAAVFGAATYFILLILLREKTIFYVINKVKNRIAKQAN